MLDHFMKRKLDKMLKNVDNDSMKGFTENRKGVRYAGY